VAHRRARLTVFGRQLSVGRVEAERDAELLDRPVRQPVERGLPGGPPANRPSATPAPFHGAGRR
jgi:hypothetical protein